MSVSLIQNLVFVIQRKHKTVLTKDTLHCKYALLIKLLPGCVVGLNTAILSVYVSDNHFYFAFFFVNLTKSILYFTCWLYSQITENYSDLMQECKTSPMMHCMRQLFKQGPGSSPSGHSENIPCMTWHVSVHVIFYKQYSERQVLCRLSSPHSS